MKMKRKDVKNLGQELDSVVRIGKSGVSEGIIDEIDRQLDDKEIIKVKVLRNNPKQDIEKTVEELEERTIGECVEIRGKTVLLVDEDELE